MTGRGVWKGPFPKLSLSSTEYDELQDLIGIILDANLSRYVQFTGVDLSTWKKLMRGKDGMQVFSYRREQRQGPHTLRLDDDSELQTLLCVDTLPGTLDSMLHSVLKSRTGAGDSSVHDVGFAAELARIKAPSPLDPFASVAIQWMELDVRRRSMGLVKNRDYVYVEATGIKDLPSGERLGYHIMHSVGIAGAFTLPGRVRSELSICSFFRQVNRTLSIYSLAILEPMNDRVRQFVVPRLIKTIQWTFNSALPSSLGKEGKHLAQTLNQGHGDRDTLRFSASGHHCVTCLVRMGRLVKLARRQNACAICCGPLCSACKIEKKQKVPSVGVKVTTKTVTFCLPCLTEVLASKGAQYSFVKDSDGVSELPPHHWAWSTKRRSKVDFASTRDCGDACVRSSTKLETHSLANVCYFVCLYQGAPEIDYVERIEGYKIWRADQTFTVQYKSNASSRQRERKLFAKGALRQSFVG